MTNFNEKLKSVYKLLSERNLTIIGGVSDDLKCGICKTILIDAQSFICGCNFCKRCIVDYKSNGGTCCPGNSDECKNIGLSNLAVNNCLNRQISRLIVRCNENHCDSECELIDMDTHLTMCSKKTIDRPFNIVGCKEKLNGEKMIDHLQIESYNHNLLLMEVINNLRNEINELRDNDRNNKCDIARIRDISVRNNNDIDMLKEMNERMKIENDSLEKDLGDMKNVMKKSNDKLSIKNEKFQDLMNVVDNMKDDCYKVIKEINEYTIQRKEYDSLKNEIHDLQRAMYDNEDKMRTIISNTTKIHDERCEMINEDVKSTKSAVKDIKVELSGLIESLPVDFEGLKEEIKQLRESKSFKEIDICKTDLMNLEVKKDEVSKTPNMELGLKEIQLKKDLPLKSSVILWTIGIIEKLEKFQYTFHECLSHRNRLYKIGLRLYAKTNELSIRLLIYKGPNDSRIEWPFKANVTVKISDNMDSLKNQSKTLFCSINQAIIHDFECSDIFKFLRSDLVNSGLWNNSECIIECLID